MNDYSRIAIRRCVPTTLERRSRKIFHRRDSMNPRRAGSIRWTCEFGDDQSFTDEETEPMAPDPPTPCCTLCVARMRNFTSLLEDLWMTWCTWNHGGCIKEVTPTFGNGLPGLCLSCGTITDSSLMYDIYLNILEFAWNIVMLTVLWAWCSAAISYYDLILLTIMNHYLYKIWLLFCYHYYLWYWLVSLTTTIIVYDTVG